MMQRGESHYHCFGCGAHGDAIQFLMTHLKMSFSEAVESLAERFHVQMEEAQEDGRPKGPSKLLLKEALETACRFYQFYLLHSAEGHVALDYLYSRGVDLEFIRAFEIGLAPKAPSLFLKVMSAAKISRDILENAGLLYPHNLKNGRSDGAKVSGLNDCNADFSGSLGISKGREFFADRITIPIRDAVGAVIGFSARKYKAETFGGKYINTPETPLFKKSKVLFGLSYSRKRIAKDRRALIVEGQIDALRLIHEGFDWTVAGQGTAFGEEMVKELLHLGVREVFLALDGDKAGQEASIKIGDFFQKEGVEVRVVSLPENSDPDLVLQEKGPQSWQNLLDGSRDYLSFLVGYFSQSADLQSPAGKNGLVQNIAQRIRAWDHPLMVHESLKKLAKLTQTPEAMLGALEGEIPQVHIKRFASVSAFSVDPDRVLEADLLRWLFLMGETAPEIVELARWNLCPEHFRTQVGKTLYTKYMEAAQNKAPRDLLTLAIGLDQAEQRIFLAEVLQKRVNREKMEICFKETVQKILERHWMQKREAIRLKIYSGTCSETEVLELARQFDEVKRQRPTLYTQTT